MLCLFSFNCVNSKSSDAKLKSWYFKLNFNLDLDSSISKNFLFFNGWIVTSLAIEPVNEHFKLNGIWFSITNDSSKINKYEKVFLKFKSLLNNKVSKLFEVKRNESENLKFESLLISSSLIPLWIIKLDEIKKFLFFSFIVISLE